MTETRSGSNRSAGIDYLKLLDEDSHPVRDILRVESPMEPGPTLVPVERYFSKEFHDVEVEKVWKRIWQMACHEDDIPDVGDYLVYNIAEQRINADSSGEEDDRVRITYTPPNGIEPSADEPAVDEPAVDEPASTEQEETDNGNP